MCRARAPSSPRVSRHAALREAGVKCLVLPAGTTAAEISSMIDVIRELPRPEKKRDRKGIAVVPRMGLTPAHKEDEGEGDDDADDE